MGDVLIDLGDLSATGRQRARSIAIRPPRPYRAVLAVLAVALVASLTGAAHVVPAAPPRLIPARLGDITFVTGDRLVVVGNGPREPSGWVQDKIIRTYALPSGALLSQTTAAVPGAIFDVTVVRHTVLVSSQVDEAGAESTVALAEGTARALWRRPARLLGVSASHGLVLLRESSPQFGPVHWYGVDLASGELRWTVTQPEHGDITGAGWDGAVPHRLVSVDLFGRLIVRDALTGAIVATRTVAVPADWARRGVALWADGDLILVGDHVRATAYGLSDLTERWRAPMDSYNTYLGTDCADALCLFSPTRGGIRVLDRATGRERWASTRWLYGEQVGRYLIVGTDDGTRDSARLAVVEAATGSLRGTFGPWQSQGTRLSGGAVLGLRQQRGGDTVWYARLDPASVRVRVLGSAREVSGDCQTTPEVLVCRRLDASVGVWRLTGAG